MRYEILFIFFAILFGCNPKAVEPIVEPNPCQPYQECDTMVVWKQRWADSLLFVTTLKTELLSNNRLLYSIRRPGYSTELIRLINASSQELIWEWKDYIPGTNGGFSSYEVIDDKYLYLNSNHEHYCIDLETGHTVWKNQESGGDYLTSHFGDKIFHFKRFGGWHAYPDSSVMYMSDIHDGVWQPIFKTKKDEGVDGYSSTLTPPSIYVDSQGDTILIFQDRRGRPNPLPWHDTELYSYNLTKKEVKWRVQHIAPTDVSSIVNPPVLDLDNKRVYFLTRFTVFCFNLETGAEIWKVPLDYAGVVSGNYFLADGKLITKTDQGYLIAFNASTGSRVYYEKMGGCCVENIKVVGDRIYFTDQALFVADVRTGKQKWKYYGSGDFSGGVAVDEANDVMYAVGSYYLYALEKPKY